MIDHMKCPNHADCDYKEDIAIHCHQCNYLSEKLTKVENELKVLKATIELEKLGKKETVK